MFTTVGMIHAPEEAIQVNLRASLGHPHLEDEGASKIKRFTPELQAPYTLRRQPLNASVAKTQTQNATAATIVGKKITGGSQRTMAWMQASQL